MARGDVDDVAALGLEGPGDAHRVIEVDAQNKIVWEVTESEIAGNKLGFAAGVQRLGNGNTVICNWPGHFASDPHEPQAFEIPNSGLNDQRLVPMLTSFVESY